MPRPGERLIFGIEEKYLALAVLLVLMVVRLVVVDLLDWVLRKTRIE